MARSYLWALILLALFAAVPARAQLKFCNGTGETVYVAVSYSANNTWYSEGWWSIVPNQCAAVIGGPLRNRNYYYYADSEEGMEWAGQYRLCTSNNVFSYREADQANCESKNFREIDIGTEVLASYQMPLTEGRTDPLTAAERCSGSVQDRNAFVKCWMKNVATNKQRHILECYDTTDTYASFAICASKDTLSRDQYQVVDCADKYLRSKVGSEFLECAAKGRLNEQQAAIFDCAVRNRGDYSAMGTCVVANNLTPEQRRVYDCVARNFNNYINAGLCAAGNNITPEQRRMAGCVLNNSGSYVQMGVCAVGPQLTPEQQAFVSCAIETGGQPVAYAGCVGGTLTVNELDKCLNQGIGGNGCFGKNNTAVQFVQNAWKDVTQGPGKGSEIVKAREQVLNGDRGTGANFIRDPIRCLTFQRKC